MVLLEISNQVKDCLQGSYDMHVHAAPDLVPRKANDIELAEMAKKYGMAGFVLKSHFIPTSERAKLVNYLVKEIKVYGSLTLNYSVGGINPAAVEINIKAGAKVVWMPTLDSIAERGRYNPVTLEDWSKAPYWARIMKELEYIKNNKKYPPISILNTDGRIRDEVLEILEIIKDNNVILATGHLPPEEAEKLIEVAYKMGIRKIIVTHPDLPSTRYSIEKQRKLVQFGVKLERCFATFFSGKISLREIIENIKLTGVENNIISTDLSPINSPYPVEGLAIFIKKLLENGFTVNEIQKMTIDNPKKLLEN